MDAEPTEDSFDAARSLLAKAAATIGVDETAPMTLTGLPEPRPRRWPVLAAAAAVVLAVGGGYLVTQQLGDDPQPAPVADQTAAADREPVEQEHVYADDELPSLLGYTTDEATQLLEARGYPLRVEAEYSCDQPAGYVLGTDPGPGTPMAAGDTVRVRVTGGPSPAARCAAPLPSWQRVFDLTRFAGGLGTPPAFPDGVSIAVGDGEYVDLTAADAADPANWVLCDDGECHSALAALVEMQSRPIETAGASAPFLVVTQRLPENPAMDTFGSCLTPDPSEQALPYHRPTYVYVDYQRDGILLCPPTPVLKIGWTENRQIGSILLRLDADDATEVVDPAEPTAERQESADAFVDWARGEGPAPKFADRVRVMFGGGGAFGSTGWVDEPENRAYYAGCSGLGFPDCGVDPVALLVRYEGPVVATAGRSTCADGGVVPTRFASATQDAVRLEEPEPASCRRAWAVELWIDADGVIYGVNQAGG